MGTPAEVYRLPGNLFVASFLGAPPINQLPLTPDGDGRLAGGPFLFPGRSPCREATLGVRPEDLAVAVAARKSSPRAAPQVPPPAPPDFTATVVRVEALGSEQRIHLDGPGNAAWVARTPPALDISPDDMAHVSVAWERTHLFGPDGRRMGPAPRPVPRRPAR